MSLTRKEVPEWLRANSTMSPSSNFTAPKANPFPISRSNSKVSRKNSKKNSETVIPKEVVQEQPELVIHIYTTRLRFKSKDGTLILMSPLKLFINYIEKQELPPDLVGLFDDFGCKYIDGCLVTNILDYRHLPKVEISELKPEQAKKKTIRLRPTQESILADISNLRKKGQTKLEPEEILKVESDILLLLHPNLDLRVDEASIKIENAIKNIENSKIVIPEKCMKNSTELEAEATEIKESKDMLVMMKDSTKKSEPMEDFDFLGFITECNKLRTEPNEISVEGGNNKPKIGAQTQIPGYKYIRCLTFKRGSGNDIYFSSNNIYVSPDGRYKAILKLGIDQETNIPESVKELNFDNLKEVEDYITNFLEHYTILNELVSDVQPVIAVAQELPKPVAPTKKTQAANKIADNEQTTKKAIGLPGKKKASSQQNKKAQNVKPSNSNLANSQSNPNLSAPLNNDSFQNSAVAMTGNINTSAQNNPSELTEQQLAAYHQAVKQQLYANSINAQQMSGMPQQTVRPGMPAGLVQAGVRPGMPMGMAQSGIRPGMPIAMGQGGIRPGMPMMMVQGGVRPGMPMAMGQGGIRPGMQGVPVARLQQHVMQGLINNQQQDTMNPNQLGVGAPIQANPLYQQNAETIRQAQLINAQQANLAARTQQNQPLILTPQQKECLSKLQNMQPLDQHYTQVLEDLLNQPNITLHHKNAIISMRVRHDSALQQNQNATNNGTTENNINNPQTPASARERSLSTNHQPSVTPKIQSMQFNSQQGSATPQQNPPAANGQLAFQTNNMPQQNQDINQANVNIAPQVNIAQQLPNNAMVTLNQLVIQMNQYALNPQEQNALRALQTQNQLSPEQMGIRNQLIQKLNQYNKFRGLVVQQQQAIRLKQAMYQQQVINQQQAMNQQQTLSQQQAMNQQQVMNQQQAVNQQQVMSQQQIMNQQQAMDQPQPMTPQQAIPQQQAMTPQQAIPQQQIMTPQQQSMTSQQQAMTPQQTIDTQTQNPNQGTSNASGFISNGNLEQTTMMANNRNGIAQMTPQEQHALRISQLQQQALQRQQYIAQINRQNMLSQGQGMNTQMQGMHPNIQMQQAYLAHLQQQGLQGQLQNFTPQQLQNLNLQMAMQQRARLGMVNTNQMGQMVNQMNMNVNPNVATPTQNPNNFNQNQPMPEQ